MYSISHPLREGNISYLVFVILSTLWGTHQTYAHNQKEYLCAFLEHGEIEISNNQVENAIRPLVVGRKNWLFSDTPEGAQASAIAYTFMETAKANRLNVHDYLCHILTVLPDRFANHPQADIRDLLPWNEEMKSQFPE